MKLTQRQAERVLALVNAKHPGCTLRMDWDWSGRPNPTILTEGVCDAIALAPVVQEQIDRARLAVWVEPYASYALSLYRKPANWRCKHCGAENDHYDNACQCGALKVTR